MQSTDFRYAQAISIVLAVNWQFMTNFVIFDLFQVVWCVILCPTVGSLSQFEVYPMRHLFQIFVVCVIASTASATATIINLGVFDSSKKISTASGISRDGSTVVGNSLVEPQNGSIGFRWTASTGMQGIFTPGGTSEAIGVCANGQAVLAYSNNQYFRWTPSGDVQDIGAGNSTGISGDGFTVVGSHQFAGHTAAFSWTNSGGIQNLGMLSGDSNAGATAANFDGTIITGVSGGSAFRWTESNGMQSLGSGSGWGISGDGSTIVGRKDDNIAFQACFWDLSGVRHDIGRFQAQSQARSVTDDGRGIVGYNSDYGENNKNAFLWTAELGMVNLHEYLSGIGVDMSHWSTLATVSISGDGTALAGGGFYDGQQRAFLVTGLNIPTPAVGYLLALAGFVSRRRF